jgi:uncharacterized lipoprotein YajG
MKKSILLMSSLLVLLFACSTPQNSVSNNNTPPPATQPSQVPTPVKPSTKYQKYKNNDKLMAAPAAMERTKAEGVIRDTM